MPELNEPQRAAVLHEAGPLLVFAGAGSGKTRVITYRIANLIAEHHVAPYRILAVTFTNKAAAELKARLGQLASPELVEDLWVGTFHSVCARLLRRYHDEVGLTKRFVIYDDSDQKALLSRVMKELRLDDKAYPPKQVLARIQKQKREGIAPHEVSISPVFDEHLRDAYAGYQEALKRCSAVDFEDLIVHVMRIAESPLSEAGKELRSRFQHVLVDEFQDTNRVQYRLVRALAAGTQNLCVVGDDDQSIYSWRGADIRNIRGFQQDFAGAEVVKLEQNYRSTGNIVKAALSVIEPSPLREPKELWTAEDAGDKVRVRATRDERDEAAFVTRVIREEMGSGTPADEIAVFYRINAQSRVLEEAMRADRIAYQIIGGMKFFDRAEVKDLIAYLRIIHNPRSDADLVRIINVPARGIGGKTLDRLLATADRRGTSAYDAIDGALASQDMGAAAKKKLKIFFDLIEDLRGVADELSPHELAAKVLEKTKYLDILRAQDTAEADARIENLKELVGSIQEYEADAEQAGDEPSLTGYLEQIALVADVDGMKDGPTVKLMTVHSAKGLEFDVVFATGMEEETFPYRGLDGEKPEELEEERRLAYVAITRARKRLSLSHASVRMLFGQTKYLAPSRFLSDLPQEILKQEGALWSMEGEARGGSGFGARSFGGPRGPGARAPIQPAWSNRGATSACSPAAPPEPEPERVIDYEAFDDMAGDGVAPRPGSKVQHKRYGRGVIERIEMGEPPKVIARFPGYGSRKVLSTYLTFE